MFLVDYRENVLVMPTIYHHTEMCNVQEMKTIARQYFLSKVFLRFRKLDLISFNYIKMFVSHMQVLQGHAEACYLGMMHYSYHKQMDDLLQGSFTLLLSHECDNTGHFFCHTSSNDKRPAPWLTHICQQHHLSAINCYKSVNNCSIFTVNTSLCTLECI